MFMLVQSLPILIYELLAAILISVQLLPMVICEQLLPIEMLVQFSPIYTSLIWPDKFGLDISIRFSPKKLSISLWQKSKLALMLRSRSK
mgnify:CR=1 FL=1